jgi:phosphoglycerol transferase MdoB-like AlkP superfamily enzyme
MYVVEPRTTAAWIATMYGIWPSTDDVNEKWTRSEGGQSAAASLPRMLRQFGYATRFITPTSPSFMGDSVVLERIGFDAVIGGEQLATNLPKLNYLGLADEQIVKPALAWVDTNVTTGRPYFLTVMTSAAHHDYKQPPSWNKRQFDPKGSGLYNDYLNSVAYTDSSLVQGLLDGLSQRHLLDSTIVIVMGDHGQAFGDHQELVHGRQVYEETTRVPMVIYAPGRVAAGQRITGNRQTIDLLPTIADLLGVEIDGGHIPGASMLSDVASDREIWLSSAFFKSSLGLREGDRKVHFFFDRAPTQVFAIAADPNEERDLSGSMPSDELRAYEDRMLLWRARVIRALLAP